MMINPITRADYPDPDIIRVGDTFYMISTTMYFFPGGEILRSYDLVHWEIAARIFDAIDGTPAEHLTDGANAYGKGMWAASLRYHNGRFYVVFVSHGQENTHLFTAEQVDGPWEHHVIRGYFHDCSLLFDDDGRIFLTSGNMQIHLTELSEDLSGPKPGGIDTVIVKDNPEKVFLGYEGSHFYKINGRYYLTLIHWPKSVSRRTEAVFTADRVEGPYVGRDVCWDDMGYHGQGVAQGGIVDTPDGRWYSVMFRDSGAVGRVPVLVPVHFAADCRDGFTDGLTGEPCVFEAADAGAEFPVFGEDGRIPESFDTPDLRPGYVYEPLFTSDDFAYVGETRSKLKPQWQWNHIPVESDWRIARNDGLAVRTGRTDANLVQARNVLTQRMRYPKCAAEVTVDATFIKEGDYAGLCAHQGCYGMIAVTKRDGGYEVVRLVRPHPVQGFGIGSNDNEPGVITDRIAVDGPVVKLRLEADFTDMADTAKFFYENDGAFIALGAEHKLAFRLDHFTGARFGLAYFAEKEAGGTVIFRKFRYE